ncbi:P-loop containing nucleoside triphosphate hydrolase protein [Dichotomocladium elegans]|nr:P-loop containing nucleoside triphosphate hydrolase protein [Dichotomocladium elegans]
MSAMCLLQRSVLNNNHRLLFRRLNSTLVELKNANIYRFGSEEPVFKDLTLSIRRDQRIVIVGPVSAVSAAKWPVIVDKSKSPYPSDHIHLVSFKEESGAFSYSGHYYQERFNFRSGFSMTELMLLPSISFKLLSDPDNDVTLKHYLATEQSDDSAISKVAAQLDIAHLLPLSFVKLSNGQTRRARIARALLRRPSMLILDEPLMGLDIQHREKMLDMLGNMADSGLPVVLVLRPQDEFPSWATDVVALKDRKIDWMGTPTDYLERRDAEKAKDVAERKEYLAQHSASEKQQTASRDAVVELKKVNVMYSGTKILNDISWTVRQGECWALLGPNGSGKTTLLSFLTGDHPQAYANELYLFGRRRGSGESIWDIKKRVGLVSPEVHLYFNQMLTGLEAAGTGFFDVVVPRPLDGEQVKTIKKLFEDFGMGSLMSRSLRDMSSGEQRMVLLIRSLVKMPDLIIWDEPFQGLDSHMIKSINTWLEDHMRADQALILVTHHEEEIPRAVTKRFRLGPGGVDAN